MALSVTAGAGLIGYGIIKSLCACSRGINDNSKSDPIFGGKEIVSGIALVASGIFTNIEESFLAALPSFRLTTGAVAQELPVEPIGVSYDALIKEACDVDHALLLESFASSCGCMTSKMFDVFNKTIGITCSNYLPWLSKFHFGGTGYIDGIHKEDMPASTGWGIDPLNRPYIAIKYECEDKSKASSVTEVGAFALFQRYTIGGPVAKGEWGSAINCPSNAINAVYQPDEFLPRLENLFRGETIVDHDLDRELHIRLAKG